METSRNFIIFLLGILFFTHCDTKHEGGNVEQLSFQQQPIKNDLTGEWKYANSIWYTSELTINVDGTFKFHDQGCYGQNYTEGQWNKNGDIVSLISFAEYKEKGKIKLEDEALRKKAKQTKPELKNSRNQYFFKPKKISLPILSGPNDTLQIYFNKFQLLLKNDTLYCIDVNQLFETAEFYKTKNNR